jgi:hypothetical protein
MTKKIFTLFFITFSFFINAQMQDLSKLMNNKTPVFAKNIYNNDESLYGYIYICSGDKVDKKNYNFEYIILDKNLNKVARNEFEQKFHKNALPVFQSCKKMGDKLLIEIGYQYLKSVYVGNNYGPIYLVTAYRTLDLKTNTISDEFYYDGEFKNLEVSNDDMKDAFKKQKSFYNIYPINNNHQTGYVVKEYFKEDDEDYLSKTFRAFDENKKPIWEYKFNENATNKDHQLIQSTYWPDNFIILKMGTFKKEVIKKINIVGLDIKTGKEHFNYTLDDQTTEYVHEVNIKKIENKIYLYGAYFPAKSKRDDWEDRLGLYRIVLDEKGK